MIWALVYLAVIVLTVEAQYPSCNFCVRDGSNITVLDALVPGTNLTCGQLYQRAMNGNFDDPSCDLLSSMDFPTTTCGCDIVPNQDRCHLCGPALPNAIVTNEYVKVEAPGIGIIPCYQLENTLKLLSPDSPQCSLLMTSTSDLQETCGCQVFQKGPQQCQNATTLTAGDTVFASVTANFGSDLCGLSNGYGTAWYKVVGTGENMTAYARRFPLSADYAPAVLTGSCDQLLCVEINSTKTLSGERVTWTTIANQEYYILVSSNDYFSLTYDVSPIPYYMCHICGDQYQLAILSDVVINVPIFGSLTCGDLQWQLSQPFFTDGPYATNSTCSSIVAVAKEACGCQTVEQGSGLCEYATTIQIGQTVYGNSEETGVAQNRFSCESWTQDDGKGDGVWYHFIGTGNVVTIEVSAIINDFIDLFVLTGSCGNQTCVANVFCTDYSFDACHGGTATWSSQLGEDYFFLIRTLSLSYSSSDYSVYYGFALTLSNGTNTLPPTPSPTTTAPFPVCYICGSNDTRVTKLDAPVPNPLFDGGSDSCGFLQTVGLERQLHPDTCSAYRFLNITEQLCGCKNISPSSASCANATTIQMGETIVRTATLQSVSSWSNITYCNVTIDSDVSWYQFVGVGDNITMNACDVSTFTTDYSAQIFVMSGACTKLSCVVASTNDCQVSWHATLGTVYYIVVNNNVGPFSITNKRFTATPSPAISPTYNTATSAKFPKCNPCGVGRMLNTSDSAIAFRFNIHPSQHHRCFDFVDLHVDPLVCSILVQSNFDETCGCLEAPSSAPSMNSPYSAAPLNIKTTIPFRAFLQWTACGLVFLGGSFL